MLVDGYNIIHAWDELRELMEDVSLESARVKLIDTLSNYKGVQKATIIVVLTHIWSRAILALYRSIIIFMWCIQKKQKRRIITSKEW